MSVRPREFTSGRRGNPNNEHSEQNENSGGTLGSWHLSIAKAHSTETSTAKGFIHSAHKVTMLRLTPLITVTTLVVLASLIEPSQCYIVHDGTKLATKPTKNVRTTAVLKQDPTRIRKLRRARRFSMRQRRRRFRFSLPQEVPQDFATAKLVGLSDNVVPNSIHQTATLSPLEALCLHKMDIWYRKSQSQKCPFLRRRAGDTLDNIEVLMKHLIIREQCWHLMGPPQAWRPCGLNKKQALQKYNTVSPDLLHEIVMHDWKNETGKGYYITGKLTTACYRDDCVFLGPDPDMPVRGLRKYIGVAAHLFDSETSHARLVSLQFDEDDVLEASWVMTGILRLPWKPTLPKVTGKTRYLTDARGLVWCHEESWDVSVAYAFLATLFPKLVHRFWRAPE